MGYPEPQNFTVLLSMFESGVVVVRILTAMVDLVPYDSRPPAPGIAPSEKSPKSGLFYSFHRLYILSRIEVRRAAFHAEVRPARVHCDSNANRFLIKTDRTAAKGSILDIKEGPHVNFQGSSPSS